MSNCGCQILFPRNYLVRGGDLPVPEWRLCPLHDAAEDLLAACRKLYGAIERQELVRSIENDGSPTWHLRMLRLIQTLKEVEAAIRRAEGKA